MRIKHQKAMLSIVACIYIREPALPLTHENHELKLMYSDHCLHYTESLQSIILDYNEL